MFFVGLDLAWSPRNNSAVSVLKGGKSAAKLVAYQPDLGSNEEIVEYIHSRVGNEPAFVAIDAPLVVPNETGSRAADKLTTSLFRAYDAGTHPANRQHLGKYGGLRGEVITKMLEERGFSHDPHVKPLVEERRVFEVYPHPAIVVLFGLKKILKYKPRESRDYAARWSEFQKFQKLLKSLGNAEPALELPKHIVSQDVTKLKAKRLKEYEDLLDSVVCAYVAHYYWRWGGGKCAVLGTLQDGYIVTPVFDWQAKQLKQAQTKLV